MKKKIYETISDFNQYYESHRAVKRIHWNYDIIVFKDNFVEQRLEKNVHLAPDYNLSLIKNSFLTDLYAAN